MKNFKVLVVAIFAMFLGAGCLGDKKASVDARPAVSDMAVASEAAPDKPYFNPTPGKYEVRLDPATSDGEADAYADPLDPFVVPLATQDAPAVPMLTITDPVFATWEARTTPTPR